jgi:hypothetical protein
MLSLSHDDGPAEGVVAFHSSTALTAAHSYAEVPSGAAS